MNPVFMAAPACPFCSNDSSPGVRAFVTAHRPALADDAGNLEGVLQSAAQAYCYCRGCEARGPRVERGWLWGEPGQERLGAPLTVPDSVLVDLMQAAVESWAGKLDAGAATLGEPLMSHCPSCGDWREVESGREASLCPACNPAQKTYRKPPKKRPRKKKTTQSKPGA